MLIVLQQLFILLHSASVLEGESDVVITRLITNDADNDKSNTDSMVQLVGVTNNMDGTCIVDVVQRWDDARYSSINTL